MTKQWNSRNPGPSTPAGLTDRPQASVIIPTCGRPDLLEDTVRSLQRLPSKLRFEILVVDNHPSPHVRDRISSLAAEHGPALRYVPEPKMGLDRSRHAGARAARAEILVYVDDDVIVPPGWLDAMLAPYDQGDIACVGGKTVPKWHSSPPPWINPIKGWLSVLDLGDDAFALPLGQSVVGCNFSIRRRVLYEVGGSHPDDYRDPRMVWYCGDGEVGLVRKVIRAGYRVMYEPRAWLYHRVTEERMVPEYFFRRAFVEGVRNGYTEFRRSPVGRTALILAAARQGCCWAHHCFRRCFDSRDLDKRVQRGMTRAYRKARMLHALRLAVDSDLRSHVLQPSYLDE